MELLLLLLLLLLFVAVVVVFVVVVVVLTLIHNTMPFVVAGQAPKTLEWKKYLGKKLKQAKRSTHDTVYHCVALSATLQC